MYLNILFPGLKWKLYQGGLRWDILTRIICGCETGFDINAGPVWLEYISFLKAAPVSSRLPEGGLNISFGSFKLFSLLPLFVRG